MVILSIKVMSFSIFFGINQPSVMIVLVKTLIGITIARDHLIGRLTEAGDTDVDINSDVDDYDHDDDSGHDAYYDADADSGSHQRGTSHPAENPM